jgi:uncharacterized protein
VKNLRIVLICLALVGVVAFIAVQSRGDGAPVGKCGVYRTDKVITIGSSKLDAELAQTKAAQAKGLGGRPCIEPGQAMLFDFGRPGQYAIWMKDMKFPIDILWITTDHTVVGIEKGVKPDTYPDSFANKDKPAQYVLELKANRSKELNVNLGSTVKF